MRFQGEFGLQLTMLSGSRYSVPEVVRFAELAYREGFHQVWTNDNLRYRNVFVVLTAIAAQVPIKVGTAVLVPYFRNPVDVADALASLSELTDGRELSVGIARGNPVMEGPRIDMVKPIAMVRETTLFLQALLREETVSAKDYPVVSTYHHFTPTAQFRMIFPPRSPIRFYCGAHGPKILRVTGEIMDGVLIGGKFGAFVRTGRLQPLMKILRQSAQASDPGKRLYNICEIDVSVSRDRARARQFPRRSVAHRIVQFEWMGFTEEEIRTLGMAPETVRALRSAFDQGATAEELVDLVPEDSVRCIFAVGDPEEVREQLMPLVQEAARLGFDQISFAKLGPDWEEAITLLSREIIPKLSW